MFGIDFTFPGSSSDDHLGFKLGDMRVYGDFGSAGTEGTLNPNLSMMLILSIVLLLDGFRRFLVTARLKQYEFGAADSSFAIGFRRDGDGRISVYVDGQLIHRGAPMSIKESIESSVLRFVEKYDLPSMMNEAEAGDFQNALSSFQEFMPPEQRC